ncbi:ACP S-malonyltransferase [Burkholderia gladioli]|uniref:Malonyl CoA-acyl carrier protein transacylase n=1 Tax=Burkholderia gladioli (strain BSR3) TaxID=999541 RepID=F2LT81_BURGS|nr:ACP S-malonyltransferase [Burkholderia gladioli]AEA66027.1 BatJ [Burkholderia gladioli BSR3]MBW5285060.1 ACP S-malonyltransferase [Burkholderia gladioli]
MEAFVFPGQGSQHAGMGDGLFDRIPEFAAQEADLNALLGYSVRTLCIENPGNRLMDTRYTQPCLFIVNALHYYDACAAGRRAQYLAGHSLGEYNALLAAGAFDLLGGVRLVKRRGELMSRAKNGGMAAVVGIPPERVLAVLREHEFDGVEIANFNSPAQTVISGELDQIRSAASVFESAGASLYHPLKVSAAFHSRFMQPASREFAAFLDDFQFAPLTTPVISNVTGDCYPAGADDTAIRALLAKQIVSPVRWVQGVGTLLRAGVGQFTELGPGKVLTKLIAQSRQVVT